MEWVFYILMFVLPISDPLVVEVIEPWAYFDTKEECDYWQEWWIHNNSWLEEFGVAASPCVEK